ncbi:MAG: hypothetical protein RJQ09_17440 [Cyclobacteriaceae bacterium]
MKKIIRPKRDQKAVIEFVEGLPKGMVQEGKASDLIDNESKKNVKKETGKVSKSDTYLVDVLLGLNEKR